MRYHICSGEIVHTYSVDGSVISQAPEVYVDEIIVEGISDKNFDMLKKKGDKLSPGDTLFTFKGTDKSVDCNAQIVDVAFETEDRVRRAVIHLLNYDKLFLVVNVSSDKIDKLSYDTKVEVQIGGKSYPSEILDIGYEIENNEVPVCVDLPVNALPGSEAKITFMLDVQAAGLYVPKDAVCQDGDTYYVNVQHEEGLQQKYITVGQFFSAEENGIVTDYVEILSGVSRDDVLVVEQIDNTGATLKENLYD